MRACACVHACVHACMHVHAHVHVCLYMHARTCMHTHTYANVFVCVRVCVCVHACAYACDCMHACMNTCIMYTNTNACIHGHILTDRLIKHPCASLPAHLCSCTSRADTAMQLHPGLKGTQRAGGGPTISVLKASESRGKVRPTATHCYL